MTQPLKTSSTTQAPVSIETMAHDGRGIARVAGKIVFIEGALPGEEVTFARRARHRDYDVATLDRVLKPSPQRVTPKCLHYAACGGCSLQHLEDRAQIHAKQEVLLDNLQRIGKVRPAAVLAPITGPQWGYRRKARLGVKYVLKKGRVLIGFREKHGHRRADLTRCEILKPEVGLLLPELAALIASFSVFNKIPQVEIAAGDDSTALVFRVLGELTAEDKEKLRGFSERHDIQIYMQPSGPDSVYPLHPSSPALSYRLPAHGVELFFQPTDFIQINAQLNRKMVDCVIGLLALRPDDRVLDLYCGIGNFTLPIARRAAEVHGVEGDPALVWRAEENARHNGIHNVRFHVADLADPGAEGGWMRLRFGKILLDPPRSGAYELIKHLPRWRAGRIVYVSCHPASLARDVGELVHHHGYTLASAGVMDMFPHTSHVEAIALLKRA